MAMVLPEELIVEILSWVPVKPLMRFKCVSKTWNSLIFHPTFVKLHLQRSSTNTHVLLTPEEEEDPPDDDEKVTDGLQRAATPCSVLRLLEENPSPAPHDDHYQFNDVYSFVGSCNGLICLRFFTVSGRGNFEYWVRFWNPATRITSQESPHLRLRRRDYMLLEDYVKFGFGYDDVSDTYKVVALVFNTKSQNWEVKVHCMGDTCWINILTCPAFPISRRLLDGHLVSGTVNWLAFRMLGIDYEWNNVTVHQLVIFSYDLKKETFKYLSMPDGVSQVPDYPPKIGVLKGCLCLSYTHRSRTHFVVWLMRQFGVEKSWTRLLNVSYLNFQLSPTNELDWLPTTPLCISENDDMMLLANCVYDEFVLHNRRDNRIDSIGSFDGKVPMCSYDYVPSLVLPYCN